AEAIPFVLSNPTINLGAQYGIFKDAAGLAVHNKIYAEYIAAYMSSKLLTGAPSRDFVQHAGAYTGPAKSLDLEKVLTRFQAFMKEEYSKQDRNFLERQGRLLFLAFLKPILNGHGYSFKEPQISEERRLDVVITFYQHRYVAELKVWRGEAAHERGLSQLAGYLDQLGLDTGYLLIFDHSALKSWRQEWVEADGKRVFAVWV
ncbi:MAG: AAA family ATPase, partial [Thermoanaerobaculia bacterium]|nr:AAA family ATPase [Thermoanaerobaculia bacterium]